MATDTLQMLNLSPIPELSEMELSSVLEHLNSVSDPNGEVTDRNMEDILREAEELIDRSNSFKADSFDSNKCSENNSNNRNIISDTCKLNSKNSETEDVRLDDSETISEMLNISLSSADSGQKILKSASVDSVKNDSNSQSELYSPTPRSITNHIQSTLDSLRECSQKIENQTKNLNENTKESLGITVHKKKQNSEKTNVEEKKLRESKITKRGPYFGEESVKESTEEPKTALKERLEMKTNLKLIEKSRSVKKTAKALSLDESIKTLDCFERLYRGRSFEDRMDNKRLKTSKRIMSDKKGMKTGKKINTLKHEGLVKDRKLRNNALPPQRNKQYDYNHQCCVENNMIKENLTDEEISFGKCLSLLQEENEQINAADTCNYLDFTEKILKYWTESVSALQGEVEDLKSKLKSNTTKDFYSAADSCLAHKFSSQENIIHKLKEENMKLFKEVEDIKGQLKMVGAMDSNGGTEKSNGSPEKFEIIRKLGEEVKNIKQSLTSSYSENNGILRLEEQFSLLKAKYDEHVGKLENENKKLKEVLVSQSPRSVSARKREERKSEIQVETEKLLDNFDCIAFEVDSLPSKDSTRSRSPENCINSIYAPLPQSLKTVDVATSPIKSSFSKTDKELCSVSVQCRGESDLCNSSDPDESRRKSGISKGFHRLENKENISSTRKVCGKTRSVLNSGNQMLNLLKQKKLSEHENQLMATVRALHSEITVKDRDNKKMKNELELLKTQIKRLGGDVAKHKSDLGKKCHVGTQTIGLVFKMQEAYDPLMFQVSRELEEENEKLKVRIIELEKVIDLLKDKRINDLQILQKLHEEEIDKLASRLKSQTALTNHLHSLLTSR